MAKKILSPFGCAAGIGVGAMAALPASGFVGAVAASAVFCAAVATAAALRMRSVWRAYWKEIRRLRSRGR
ncbi:MAG: hypothetical protein ACYTGZ_20475 [Planctomycetota bacterium]|jgi:hypothetical protein